MILNVIFVVIWSRELYPALLNKAIELINLALCYIDEVIRKLIDVWFYFIQIFFFFSWYCLHLYILPKYPSGLYPNHITIRLVPENLVLNSPASLWHRWRVSAGTWSPKTGPLLLPNQGLGPLRASSQAGPSTLSPGPRENSQTRSIQTSHKSQQTIPCYGGPSAVTWASRWSALLTRGLTSLSPDQSQPTCPPLKEIVRFIRTVHKQKHYETLWNVLTLTRKNKYES